MDRHYINASKMEKYEHILFFNQIDSTAIGKVGGKNASLGEMYSQLNPLGINISNGFAVTSKAYRLFRKANNLEKPLQGLMDALDTKNYSNLSAIGEKARALIESATIPQEIIDEIQTAYSELGKQCGIITLNVAVRSSASSEDLPTASFAGQIPARVLRHAGIYSGGIRRKSRPRRRPTARRSRFRGRAG